MRATVRSGAHLLPLLCVVAVFPVGGVTACGDGARRDPPADGWAGSIDTIGGRVVVRNPASPVWRAGEEWRIAEELRIGALDGTGPDVFGNITALAVSADGDIAVLDVQAFEVRVFDRDGRHVRSFGRSGGGPGELRNPLGVHFDAAGRIWVPDAANARYHVFAADGTLAASGARPVGGLAIGTTGVMTVDGRLIDPTSVAAQQPDGWFALGVRGLSVATADFAIDSLPTIMTTRVPDASVPAALAPFMPRTVLTFDVRGGTWFAPTDGTTIYYRSAAGDTARVIEIAAPRRGEARWEADSIAAILAAWPVRVDVAALGVAPQRIRSLHADEEGRLFVRPAAGRREDEGTVFDAFDADGRYLGRVRSDVRFEPRPAPLFRNGAVYGVTHDEDGVPYVVRAALRGG